MRFINDFQTFLCLTTFLLAFYSSRSLFDLPLNVFLVYLLAKLPLTSNFQHLLFQGLIIG